MTTTTSTDAEKKNNKDNKVPMRKVACLGLAIGGLTLMTLMIQVGSVWAPH